MAMAAAAVAAVEPAAPEAAAAAAAAAAAPEQAEQADQPARQRQRREAQHADDPASGAPEQLATAASRAEAVAAAAADPYPAGSSGRGSWGASWQSQPQALGPPAGAALHEVAAFLPPQPHSQRAATTDIVCALEFEEHGWLLASAGVSKQVRVYSLASCLQHPEEAVYRQPIRCHRMPSKLSSLAWNPDAPGAVTGAHYACCGIGNCGGTCNRASHPLAVCVCVCVASLGVAGLLCSPSQLARLPPHTFSCPCFSTLLPLAHASCSGRLRRRGEPSGHGVWAPDCRGRRALRQEVGGLGWHGAWGLSLSGHVLTLVGCCAIATVYSCL